MDVCGDGDEGVDVGGNAGEGGSVGVGWGGIRKRKFCEISKF